MLIKKVNFGIICLMFLLLSPLTHAESGLCQDLAKFSCSPGRQDDGTGSSTVPTIAEVLKIFDGLNFQKEETENKFRKLLADPQNGELKNLAMSSSGLADSPQCVSKTPASISKCTSDTIEGLMELTKRTLLGQRNFVLNKDGGYGEKYLLSENKQFKDTIGELEKELSKRSARPEVENKIEATIFPRIKELLREKINALPIDEKRKRAMQDKLNTAHYAGSDCDEMAAGLSKDYIPNAFMNPKNGAFKICKGFFRDGTSDFHLAGVIAHEHFQTHVFFGDKTAQFRIWSNKSSRHYSATMPDTKIKNGRLSKKDYQFYVKMASEAALEASNDPTFCPRNQIAMDYILKGQKVQKIGCIGSPSPVAKRLVSLANALQFLK